jgi:hypothetical protein
MNPGIIFFLYQVPMAYSEGGRASREQGNFLSLGWKTIIVGGRTISFPIV